MIPPPRSTPTFRDRALENHPPLENHSPLNLNQDQVLPRHITNSNTTITILDDTTTIIVTTAINTITT